MTTNRPAALQEGARFGDYQLKERLGAGGMGEVFRAIDLRCGRLVALKVLSDPAATARFDNEARIHARMAHAHIARLFESGETDGHRYIAMEYISGVTLAQYIAHRGRLGAADATALFGHIARAVAYMHQQGVLHQDLKSDNIKILPDGQPRLFDFGIAQDAQSPAGLQAGGVAGTVQYLAPEVIDGHPACARSEVWSLGVLLYEMSTGRLPFDGPSLARVLDLVRRGAYVDPAQRCPDLPTALLTVIGRSLQVDPARRWASVPAMLDALCAPEVPQCAPVWPAVQLAAQSSRDLLAQVRAGWLALDATGQLARLMQVGLGVCVAGVVAAGTWVARGPADGWHPPIGPTPVRAEAAIRVDTLGGPAEVWSGSQLLGRTPFTHVLPVGSSVHLTLRWTPERSRDITFDVRDNVSANTYIYPAPSL